MKAIVNIQLKPGVLDPQGKAVHHALRALGFDSVEDVRIGKQIILNIKEDNQKSMEQEITKMCEELLANTVIENYEIEII